jgi:hypothetical protein
VFLIGQLIAAIGVSRQASAITRDEVLARAKQWIDAGLPYCQAPNGGYDGACGKKCVRPSNPTWDPYRSDCSGYVSWAWGLPAPGKVVSGLASISNVINASDLKPGDALSSGGHIMLFVGWVNGQSKIKIWHEGDCGQVAQEKIYSVSSVSGSFVHTWDSFQAIRYPGIVDDTPPHGSLDQIDCKSIAGWAQDPDVPDAAADVHLYIDGPAGDPAAKFLSMHAAAHRDDLCSALGSCNHGFSFPTPRSLLDGTSHPIHAYGIGLGGGANAEIAQGPLLCPPPSLESTAVLRRVASAASFEQWKFSAFQDVAPLPDVASKVSPATAERGPDLPFAPEVVRADDGASDVWLLDSGVRRRIHDDASLAAWRLGAPSELPAQKLYMVPQGADWPDTPELVEDIGPTLLVIDRAFLPEPAPPESPKSPAPPASTPAPESPAPPTTTADAGAPPPAVSPATNTASSVAALNGEESSEAGCSYPGSDRTPGGDQRRSSPLAAVGLSLAMAGVAARRSRVRRSPARR